MSHTTRKRLLLRAAQRTRENPAYTGWVFARYMELESVSTGALAKLLSTNELILPKVELCLRPRPKHLIGDVREIASKFQLDATAFMKVIRLVETVEAMSAQRHKQETAHGVSLVMAARARKKKQPLARRRKDSSDDSSEP